MAESRMAEKKTLGKVELLISGGFAGTLSRTITAPLDRVKILYQVSPLRQLTLIKVAKSLGQILRHTGVTGLWRGNGVAIARMAPYSAITFMTFDQYERFISKSVICDGAGISSRFLAGAAAGVTATTFTYPLDLLRARMAAHWGTEPLYRYRSAFKEIVRVEGLRSLAAGLTPTLVGIVPYCGIAFTTFETLKEHLQRRGEGISHVERLTCGGFAGLLAQTATYPLHVVRRRMQVQGTQSPNGLPPEYGSMRAALRHIYLNEGTSGLFKGLTLSWLKTPIAVALSFSLNDLIKSCLTRQRSNDAPNENSYVVSERECSISQDHATVSTADKLIRAPSSSSIPTVYTVAVWQLSATQQLVAGGMAGAVAKSVIAPADRVKILYQVNPERAFSLKSAFRTGQLIHAASGVSGLWRGNMATMARVVPYSAITYMTFDRYERQVSTYIIPDSKVFSRFVAGASAGATATAATYPLDLVRARMAADWATQPKYSGVSGALIDVVRKEGPASLWRGIGPTLLGIAPYAGLSFASFHTLKSRVVEINSYKSDRDIPTVIRLACGGLAGLFAQSATYPLDILRRRLQVNLPGTPPSISALVSKIWLREGWRGFYKGLTMNWVKGPIAVAVSFAVNDRMKQLLQESDCL